MERKLIAIAVSSALCLPMAAHAVEFSAYGQVSRAIISVDGGDNDNDLQHVDADSSESRFGFEGSGDLDNGVTASVVMELSVTADLREAHVSLGGGFGSVTIGHTAPSSDGANYPDFGAAFLGGVTNSCSYHSNDGAACQDYTPGGQPILRYDSPEIGAASISTSVGNNEFWDVAASAAGSFGDSGYDVRIAHVAEFDDGNDGDQTIASAMAHFPQGTTAAFAWAGNHRTDDSYRFVGVSQSYGDGAAGVYYKQGEMDGNEGSAWGVGLGQALGAGVHAFAGYRLLKEDGAEDESVLFAGMRVKFN